MISKCVQRVVHAEVDVVLTTVWKKVIYLFSLISWEHCIVLFLLLYYFLLSFTIFNKAQKGFIYQDKVFWNEQNLFLLCLIRHEKDFYSTPGQDVLKWTQLTFFLKRLQVCRTICRGITILLPCSKLMDRVTAPCDLHPVFLSQFWIWMQSIRDNVLFFQPWFSTSVGQEFTHTKVNFSFKCLENSKEIWA